MWNDIHLSRIPKKGESFYCSYSGRQLYKVTDGQVMRSSLTDCLVHGFHLDVEIFPDIRTMRDEEKDFAIVKSIPAADYLEAYAKLTRFIEDDFQAQLTDITRKCMN